MLIEGETRMGRREKSRVLSEVREALPRMSDLGAAPMVARGDQRVATLNVF